MLEIVCYVERLNTPSIEKYFDLHDNVCLDTKQVYVNISYLHYILGQFLFYAIVAFLIKQK